MTNPPGHNVRRLLPGIALACLLTLGHPAWAADTQLQLRNGDRLTGRVIAEDTTRVTLTNDLLGTVSIPLSQISKRRLLLPDSPAAVPPLDAAAQRQLDDARAAYVTGQISSTEYYRQRAKILAQSSLAQPAAIAAVPLTPAGAATAAAPPAPGQKPVMKLSGEIQAGLDLALATKDRQLYTGRLKLQHSYDKFRNTADYLFTYGRTEGELSANRMDGTVKNDYDLTTELYAYHQANAGYDEVRKLDNYWQVGPGSGWHAVKGTNLVLNLEAGVNFQEENRSDGTDTDVFSYRLAEHGKWVLNHRFTLDQKLEFFPQWDDFAEYKLRFETTLKLALNGHLSLNLTLIDLYDTMPAPGVEPNDLQIRSTLGVRF